MSFPFANRLPLEWLDRVLRRRWVQVGLFVGFFLLFWLLGTRTAYA